MLSVSKKVCIATFMSLMIVVLIGISYGAKKRRHSQQPASFEELCHDCKILSHSKKPDNIQSMNVSLPVPIGKAKLGLISDALKEKYSEAEYDSFVIHYQLANKEGIWAVYEYASELTVSFPEEEQNAVPEHI